MTPFRLLPLLLLLALVVPGVVGENVTYPQEYYTLGSDVDKFFGAMDAITYCNAKTHGNCWNLEWTDNINAFSNYAAAKELRRQTILMEKQNEILQEQVSLLKWQRNAKLECTSMVGAVGCYEYAWVGGAA